VFKIKIQSRDTCYTEVGWVLEDIRHILRYLGCISFISLNNSCNNVAQTLAGFAKEKDVTKKKKLKIIRVIY
jgi:hypothetical protein